MAIERIINLRVDTGDSDPKIEKTTSTLDKLNKKVVELEGDIKDVQKAASEPIKLDVKADKAKIDALVASMGDVKKQKEILGDKPVEIDVDSNIPEAKKELEDFGKSLKDIEFDKKIELAIDASKAASSIAEVKASQRELQSLLLQTTEGSDSFNKLAVAAGESKDKVDDVNTAIKAFSKSPIENLAGGFKTVKNSLLDLNFVEFNKQVGLLGQNAKKVSFKELSGEIVNTGKSFLSLGKIILANPIGLIATIIGLVVANFDSLKKGIEKIFPPFKLLEALVGGIVEIFKDLGDALGLTSFAADEATQATIDASNKRLGVIKANAEREIAIAQAAGKDVAAMQARLTQATLKETGIQIDALEEKSKRLGELSEEDQESLNELRESYQELTKDIQVFAAAAIKNAGDLSKELQKNANSARENAKGDTEAEIAAQKQATADAIDQLKEREKSLLAQESEGSRKRLAIKNGTKSLIEKLETDLEASISATRKKGQKEISEIAQKEIEDAKKVSEARIKAAQDAANAAFLDEASLKLQEAKNSLQFDSIESARLLLKVNGELQKAEEKALTEQLARKLAIADLTQEQRADEIAQFNEAKQALNERYAAEGAAATRTIELLRKRGDIDIAVRLDTALFEVGNKELEEKIQDLQKQKIDIEARIMEGDTSDGTVAAREKINQELAALQGEADAARLKQQAQILEQETAKLKAERENQLAIIRDTNVSDELRAQAEESTKALDIQIQKNQEAIALTEEYAEIISRTSETNVSAQDAVTLSLIKQFKAIEEGGGKLTKFQKDFLSKNRNFEIELKIKGTQTLLTDATKKMQDLQALLLKQQDIMNRALEEDPAQLLPSTQNIVKQTEQTKKDITTATAEVGKLTRTLTNDQTTQSEDEQEEERKKRRKAIRDQTIDETLATFQLLGEISVQADRERLQKQFEKRSEEIERQSSFELDQLQQKLDKGQITQETFDKQSLEIEAKAEAAREVLAKSNFEKEKKLKLKQLRIESAIEIGRIWAGTASMQPYIPVGLTAGLIGSAGALVRYGIQASAIQNQTFEDGGQVGSTQDAGKTSKGTSVGMVQGPSHDGGGVKHTVRSNPSMTAELEGGEWIVPKNVVAQTPIQRLRELNAGRLKLFEDGGIVSSQINAANSLASAAGSNVLIPNLSDGGESPVGFSDRSDSEVVLRISDLESATSSLNRAKRRVTFRS